jgi:hypothetical protein
MVASARSSGIRSSVPSANGDEQVLEDVAVGDE